VFYVLCRYLGGDQSVYLNFWVDTEIQTIINSKLDKITVGGTSAGLAILGNWIFNSANDTIYSSAALQVPGTRLV
jgi:cyanophycinase